MALNTITQIKLTNGKVVDLVDWSDQPLFSSVDLQTGFTTQEISLFQYVSGDNVPGFAPAAPTTRTATDNDTNLATPGAMASTEEMLVYAIKPEIYQFVVDADTNDFTTRSYDNSVAGQGGLPIPTAMCVAVLQAQLILQLEISQKVFAQASFGYFNTGYGVFSSGAQGVGPTSINSFGANGLPSQSAVRSFVIPHHIGSQEKFRLQLINASDLNSGAVDFGYMSDGSSGIALNAEAMVTLRILLDGLYKRPTA